MAQIQLGNSVSLAKAKEMIKTVGTDVTFMLQGGMGIGKSSILWDLAKEMPDYLPIYMDATTMDLGDVSGVPKVRTLNGMEVTTFAPNEMLGMHQTKPVLLMVDEFGKAMRPVQNTFLRILLERALGNNKLPKDSIVFGTTNLVGEGLGDMVQPHARNRMSFVTVRSPDADEWTAWALDNEVAPEVVAWVTQNPQCLASFTDESQKDNPYIYHPNKPVAAFCTPRSLTKASKIIVHRGHLGEDTTIAGVAGCVGESAARDMMAYAALADKLPTWESIVKDPTSARLPENGDAAAGFITVFSALSRVEKPTFDAWMIYCQRMAKEFQGVFCLNVVKSNKRAIALTNRKFVEWATQNHWMLDNK